VPADYPTIQQGIAAAADGDTVRVGAGTYRESIDYLGKAITVRSDSGPQTTTIRSFLTNQVVTIVGTNISRNCRLEGFTITNGKGGVYLSTVSAAIVGNIVVSNSVCVVPGISAQHCSSVISNNVITGNYPNALCSSDGGGISIGGGSGAQIDRNIITNNATKGAGGGIYLNSAGNVVVRDNLIAGNSAWTGGAGFHAISYSTVSLINNIIAANTSTNGCGGIDISVPSGGGNQSVLNNTIVDNRGGTASGVLCQGYFSAATFVNNLIVAPSNQVAFYVDNSYVPGQPVIMFSDLYSASGPAFEGAGSSPFGLNGNISADPLFVNEALQDFHLKRSSPAIDSGTNSYAPTSDFDDTIRPFDGDQDGVAIADMGAYEWHLRGARLLAPGFDTNHQPALTWESVGGLRYRVQYSDGGAAGEFNGVFTEIVRSAAEETDPAPEGQPSTMSFSDLSEVPQNAVRYYRIRTLSP